MNQKLVSIIQWLYGLDASDLILLFTLFAILWYTIETVNLRRWQKRQVLLDLVKLQTKDWTNVQKAKGRYPLILRKIIETGRLDTRWGFSRAYHKPVTLRGKLYERVKKWYGTISRKAINRDK